MDYAWEFTEAKPSGWTWRCVDKHTGSVVRLCARTFPVLYDCVEDAKLNGYTPPPLRVSPPDADSPASKP